MKLEGEIDYSKYTNELLLKASSDNIPDYIEALKETSILKGEVFYKKIKKSTSSHWVANAESKVFKLQYDSIINHCDLKIKEINDEKGFWPKLIRNNLASGAIGTILGVIITVGAEHLLPKQKQEVQIHEIVSIVHDTIYVTNLQGSQDTSLVRLVK